MTNFIALAIFYHLLHLLQDVKVSKLSLLPLIFVGFVLASCQSTSNKEPIKLPSWVTSPPQDTANIFYGLGSGYNLKTANAAALKDVSSKLGVTVSSIYQQRQQVANQSYQKYIDEQVQLSTEQTPITQYQVLNNEAINQTVYSLIKVEKTKILHASEEKLQQENLLAKNMLEKQQSTSKLIWHSQSSKLLQSNARNAYRLAAIIKLLAPENNIKKNLSSWNLLSEQVINNQKDLCVALIDQNKQSGDFIKAIKESLTKQQIKIINQCEDKILISSTEQQSFLFKKYISSNEINFELIDNKSISLASHSMTLSGQSVSNYTNARKAAVGQMKQKLQEQSIWQILAITQ